MAETKVFKYKFADWGMMDTGDMYLGTLMKFARDYPEVELNENDTSLDDVIQTIENANQNTEDLAFLTIGNCEYGVIVVKDPSIKDDLLEWFFSEQEDIDSVDDAYEQILERLQNGGD